jgi:hypothetical protein
MASGDLVALVLVFQSSAGVVKRKRPLLIDGSTTLTDLVKIAAGRDGRELWPSAFAEKAMKMGSRYFLFSCWNDGLWLPVPHFAKLAHLASGGTVQVLVATAERVRRVAVEKPDSCIATGSSITKPLKFAASDCEYGTATTSAEGGATLTTSAESDLSGHCCPEFASWSGNRRTKVSILDDRLGQSLVPRVCNLQELVEL